MFNLYYLSLSAIFLPLIAAIVTGFFGKVIGRVISHSFTILCIAASFGLSVSIILLLNKPGVESLNYSLYTWADIGGIQFNIGFLIDKLSAFMMCVVTSVSLMVHIYTIGYMHLDRGYQRFFCYIALFTFMMLMLITSNNLLQLFFGWEGVGLVSYLLIGFWFHKETAVIANFKAFIVNRVSDFGFLIGLALILFIFKSLDYHQIFSKLPSSDVMNALQLKGIFGLDYITLICGCLFIGAMGKSAQIPLHVWLPDSMEGPTPISALIHAATMVTAGIFMVTRLAPLFELSTEALNIILIIGSTTCISMGLIGIVQNDIKRIIAYSTLSQLGYMVASLGVSHYDFSIFHLCTHAFFKALLFLGAGSVILSMHHEQNIWKMGGLRKAMPITYGTMLIGSLALCGIPFFSGAYSKDLIIESVKASTLPGAHYAYWAILINVFVTSLYTFRLIFVVFHNENSHKDASHKISEAPKVMWLPLVLLAVPSLISGYLLLTPMSSGYLNLVSTIHHPGLLLHPFEFALEGFKELPFLFSVLGILCAWFTYVKYPHFSDAVCKNFSWVHRMLIHKYGFDLFYEKVVCKAVRGLGFVFWHIFDQLLIDKLLVNGTGMVVKTYSVMVQKMQTGYLYHYIFIMIIGVMCFMAYPMI